MLARLQDHLEAIYGYSCGERAERFVVGAEAARQLGGTGRAPEELLVAEDPPGSLEVALYLDPALLAWALKHCEAPPSQVMDADLGAFCQLTEGVSHFMYLARAAEEERHVSLLELEAQAEVDKFASCLLHRWGEGVLEWARLLLHRLFEAVSYRDGLPGRTLALRGGQPPLTELLRTADAPRAGAADGPAPHGAAPYVPLGGRGEAPAPDGGGALTFSSAASRASTCS